MTQTSPIVPQPDQPVPAPPGPPRGRRPCLRLNDVILALLSHPTLVAAADSLQVGKATLWRYMKREDFRLAYESASYSLFYNATSQLQQVAMKGVETLTEIMCDPASQVFARIFAARYAVQLAFRAADVQAKAIEKRAEDECLQRVSQDMTKRGLLTAPPSPEPA